MLNYQRVVDFAADLQILQRVISMIRCPAFPEELVLELVLVGHKAICICDILTWLASQSHRMPWCRKIFVQVDDCGGRVEEIW